MTPAEKVQTVRSIVSHADDPGRALDDIRAVLDGASLDELAERRER